MSTTFYPANPLQVPPEFTKPAAAFQRQVMKVICAIVFFCLAYLLLLAIAIALAIGSVYLGGLIFSINANAITMGAGLGIIVVGLLVVFFMVKFIFSTYSSKDPGRKEIFAHEHPELFSFLEQLTHDTNTPMPKRVFITADVNAGVFYDSSFWSMFFPVKKNLAIGLGLVNCVNLSELKMILAHEFGHFSQRSMKLGSYVFTMNRAIYNMLYENNGYNDILEAWASLHNVFALMSVLTARIIYVIQSILKLLYRLINLSYMKLSREMEFHADTVALSVTSSSVAISAMRRVSFGANCMQFCTQKAAAIAGQQQILVNMFSLQQRMMRYGEQVHGMEIENGLPVISDELLNTYVPSRLVIKNQWASHPSEEEREARYRAAAIENITDIRSAWILFRNSTTLQEEMTKHYASVHFKEMVASALVSDDAVMEEVFNEGRLYEYPAAFGGFYDSREFQVIDESFVATDGMSFDMLYSPENIRLLKRHAQNVFDLQVLWAIKEKKMDIKHFQFDDDAYTQQQAANVFAALEQEVISADEWLSKLNQEAYYYHQAAAVIQDPNVATLLQEQYKLVLVLQSAASTFHTAIQIICERIEYIYAAEGFELSVMRELAAEIKTQEDIIKKIFKQMQQQKVAVDTADKTFATDVAAYLDTNYTYLIGREWQEAELVATFRFCRKAEHNSNNVLRLARKAYLQTAVQLYTGEVNHL
ncbi:M48 family metallopeptidase [Chitinophaga sp. 30R24]|uniref:M48 family metallopeptidase n=1 Tax=Chitinophaga sp. 30R24 TaxID=3248838 RepID=UPI003B8F5591